MTARTKTFTALATVASILVGCAFAWLYTRPAVSAEDVAEIRSRAARLRSAYSAPATNMSLSSDCRAYRDAHLAIARRGIDGEPETAAPEERDRQRRACEGAFGSAWDTPALDDLSVGAVITIGLGLVEDAASSGPEAVLSWALRTIWILDSLARSGAVDISLAGRGSVRWMTTSPSLASMRPITDEEATRLRAMLARVRAAHPNRLHHLERLPLALFDWDSDDEAQPLFWVCREHAVELADRLAALHCESRTARDCFEAAISITEAFDSMSTGESPPWWARWLPPRLRRSYDADCPPSSEDVRELITQALAEEVSFALFDEVIAHALGGSDVATTMRRPAPTFEGEPIDRVVVRQSWGAEISHLEPSWVGRRDGVLSLYERRAPRQ